MSAAPVKKPRTKKVTAVDTAPVVIGWKGFDKNLACRGYQFKVGETFVHSGRVEACSSGFHACENPFDVWSYYGLGDGNRFCRVHLSGELSRHTNDSKVAASRLYIESEVTTGEMIRAGVEYVVAATLGKGDNPSGYGAQIGSSGYGARIGSSGNDAQIGSSGYGARIGSSGNGARIGSSGYGAQIGSSGNDAQIGSSGYGARIGSSGNGARIGSSGNDAQIGSSGNDAQIGSSGYGARIGSSGNGARIGSSGNDAQIGSSGDGAQIDGSGENASIAAAGYRCMAKAGEGGAITLAWWDGKRPRHVTGYVGEDGIKADTWYRADAGNLVEVQS